MLDPSLPPRKSRPTVFLIEDEPNLRRSLQLLLQGRGFAVRAFASPQSLLADCMRDLSCASGDWAHSAIRIAPMNEIKCATRRQGLITGQWEFDLKFPHEET